MKTWLIDNNIATSEELEEIDNQAKKDVLEGKKAAWNALRLQ
jgi:TPP-dependent pyruvate/acetoin dehydrogenase alpha subunit